MTPHDVGGWLRVTGLGTVQYCDHGDGLIVPLEVIDWHPFDYISFDIATPLGLAVQRLRKALESGAFLHAFADR